MYSPNETISLYSFKNFSFISSECIKLCTTSKQIKSAISYQTYNTPIYNLLNMLSQILRIFLLFFLSFDDFYYKPLDYGHKHFSFINCSTYDCINSALNPTSASQFSSLCLSLLWSLVLLWSHLKLNQISVSYYSFKKSFWVTSMLHYHCQLYVYF